ncbi:Uncharacterized protein DBV15_11094 [Temnothorax longispinosus]|uniref:Uncharacterized protein n=1 Tax=Temnothorax longispinosus TaxID=300112 RepID=A0A4S2JD56_9HYME|nr:Uncharacterized protein DBV15_11094 [Temnothorax longispinosus]
MGHHGWNAEWDPARGMNKGQKASLRLSDRRAGVGNTKQVPFADWKHVPVLGARAVCQLIRAVSGGVISSSAVPLWDFKNLSVFEKSVTLLRKEPTTTLNPA